MYTYIKKNFLYSLYMSLHLIIPFAIHNIHTLNRIKAIFSFQSPSRHFSNKANMSDTLKSSENNPLFSSNLSVKHSETCQSPHPTWLQTIETPQGSKVRQMQACQSNSWVLAFHSETVFQKKNEKVMFLCWAIEILAESEFVRQLLGHVDIYTSACVNISTPTPPSK